jgi:hypothetical protein
MPNDSLCIPGFCKNRAGPVGALDETVQSGKLSSLIASRLARIMR